MPTRLGCFMVVRVFSGGSLHGGSSQRWELAWRELAVVGTCMVGVCSGGSLHGRSLQWWELVWRELSWRELAVVASHKALIRKESPWARSGPSSNPQGPLLIINICQLYNMSKTGSAAGNQAVKHLSPWETLHTQTITLSLWPS